MSKGVKEYNEFHLNLFNYIKDGSIKADFFQICIYSDINNIPLVSLYDFIENHIGFLTLIQIL